MLLKFSVVDNITHKKSQYYTSGSISLKIKIIVRLKKNGSKSSSNSLMRFVPVALNRRLPIFVIICIKPFQNNKGQKNLRYPAKKQSYSLKTAFLSGTYLTFFWPFLFLNDFRWVNYSMENINSLLANNFVNKKFQNMIKNAENQESSNNWWNQIKMYMFELLKIL